MSFKNSLNLLEKKIKQLQPPIPPAYTQCRTKKQFVLQMFGDVHRTSIRLHTADAFFLRYLLAFLRKYKRKHF